MKNFCTFSTLNASYMFLIKQKYFFLTSKEFNSIIEDYPELSLSELKKKYLSITKKEDFLNYIKKIEYLNKNGLLINKEKTDLPVRSIGLDHVEYLYQRCSQVIFELTTNCQLSCVYCTAGELYTGFNKEAKTVMTKEIALCFLHDRLSRWNNLNTGDKEEIYYISFYGGEPLLNFDVMSAIVDYVNKNKKSDLKVQFTMTTNGILLSKYLSYLVSNNFKIMISLDGDKDDNSNRVFKSGRDSFSIVINEINKIKVEFPDFFKSNITFNSVVTSKTNYSRINNFFKQNFDKRTSLNLLNTDNINPLNYEKYSKLYSNLPETNMDIVDEVSKSVTKENAIYRMLNNMRSYWRNTCQDFSHVYSVPIDMIRNGTCLPFEKKIFVTSLGKISPCEKVPDSYTYGVINNDMLLVDFKEIVEEYNKFHADKSKQCCKCLVYPICNACLYSCANPDCHLFSDTKKLSDKLTYIIALAETNSDLYIDSLKDFYHG